VVAIGIDAYPRWGRLNAVNDARGVLALFRQIGFEEVVPSLTDGAATFAAIRRLVMTELKRALRDDDGLVLFFAGHGHTETAYLQAGTELAIYLQRRVGELRSGAQTPDFGALPLDAGGDLVLSLVGRVPDPRVIRPTPVVPAVRR
jgi:hypothetical protein